MKTHFSRILSAVLIAGSVGVVVLPQTAAAANDHAQHAKSSSTANPGMTEGLIKKVDKQKGNIVISHGPLPNGMPAMTMAFRAKDPSWIDQLKEGQKIRFATEEVNGVMILQRYEAVK